MLFIKYVINRIGAIVLSNDMCGEGGGGVAKHLKLTVDLNESCIGFCP